jgi:NitT/TauT family transport system substrate-binding protein
MASPFLSDTVGSGAGTLLAQAAPGTSSTGVLYSGAFVRSPAAQPFFDALARGAQDLQGARATSPDNLKIEAAATGQSLDVLGREPASVYDPRLAPPIATLDSMQQVFLQGGLLNYPTPVPAGRYTDGTFAAHVPVS